MSKKTLKLKDQKYWNKPLNVPVDGEVNVNAEGEISVSQEAAEILIGIKSTFIDPEVEEEVETNDVEKENNEKEEEIVQVDLTLEEINAIDSLTKKELNELAKRYKVKGYDKISDKKKPVVVAFLKNTLIKKIKK